MAKYEVVSRDFYKGVVYKTEGYDSKTNESTGLIGKRLVSVNLNPVTALYSSSVETGTPVAELQPVGYVETILKRIDEKEAK